MITKFKIFENDDKYKDIYPSDLLRMDLITTFLKNVDFDKKYNIEEPDNEMLLDAYDGYEYHTYIQNNLENNEIIYWEGWSSICWKELYNKPEFKGLSKTKAIEKVITTRFPRIAQEFDMIISDSEYFFQELYDDYIPDGYIMKIIMKKK